MARVRTVLFKLQVRPSLRANECKHNSKHKIPKGDLWLVVTPPGAASRDYGYCVDCGTAILEAAQSSLSERLAALRPSADS
ncbi:hypothetical protein [Frankia tisae]|uniref:hypothetical protein n=1 Tax=Frankia tisae TaxID=2950104 RepID=UPI0021C15B9C|nr:hypothetical protein [Frankia tisae]